MKVVVVLVPHHHLNFFKKLSELHLLFKKHQSRSQRDEHKEMTNIESRRNNNAQKRPKNERN